MKDHSSEFSVERMAAVFNVSRSGYYHWLSRAESPSSRDRRLFDLEVKASHSESKGKYGRDRILLDLGLKGRKASRKRVGASMKRQGLRSKPKRRFKATTNSRHDFPIAQNLLNRNFSVEAPNQAWVTDITYLPARSGWLYLTVFIDLYSRMVVGWAVSDSLSHEGVLKALYRAVWKRRPPAGLIIHSDRGVQFCCDAFRKTLEKHGVIQSMSRKGNCWDNAVSESFFGHFKTELLQELVFYNLAHAESELFKLIDLFYNGRRIHTTVGMPPIMFEKRNQIKCA